MGPCRVGSPVESHAEGGGGLCTGDVVVMAASVEECVRGLLAWRGAVGEKGLRVGAGRAKIMICSTGLDLLQGLGGFPCAVCHAGEGGGGVFCGGCGHWVMQWARALERGP